MSTTEQPTYQSSIHMECNVEVNLHYQSHTISVKLFKKICFPIFIVQYLSACTFKGYHSDVNYLYLVDKRKNT